MFSIAVVGAGIAGLLAAYRLQQGGLDVTVFEAGAQPGGVIRSERTEGYLVEHGPNSIQARTKLLESLVGELDLQAPFVEADAAAKRRFVVRGGRPVALPTSPPAFLKTGLFSAGAKLRLLREPFVRPAPPDAEETIADFVRRRLGREWLDYAINPFVAGVFAGDPERLALRHAFPRMQALEQEYGSLIRGQVKKSREQKRMVEPAPSGRMFSFRDGLQTLPEALAARLEHRVRYRTPVTAVTPNAGRWRVGYRSDEGAAEGTFDAVLLTTPLHRLPELGLEADLRPLEEVWYPPVRVVALGYRRDAVRHPLDGFGMLVPAVETDFRILGTLFSSTLFPNRAPDGHVLLTTFVGGARHPDLASAPEEEAQHIVARDLGKLLGIVGAPAFARHVFWAKAIPQYEVGYGGVKDRIDHIESNHAGFFMAGNYRQGISVADTLASADDTAARILAWRPHA